MKVINKGLVYAGLKLLSALLLVGVSQVSHAFVVFIDEFAVTKNGLTSFIDSFSDGIAPPNAPNFTSGDPALYSVSGIVGIGPETNGKLRLDASNGSPSFNAAGVESRGVNARLLTSFDPNNLSSLHRNASFSASGLFDIPAVHNLQSNYQVAFFERNPSSSLSLTAAQIEVTRGTGLPSIRFRHSDFVTGSITTISEVPFDLSSQPDQIRLALAYSSTAGAVTASYELLQGGISLGGPNAMAGTSGLFVYSEGVRPRFSVFTTVVPLPAAAWLLGAGFIALLGVARRRPSE